VQEKGYKAYWFKDPRTLPDEVFTLLDNLVAFTFRNEDELRQLAKSGLINLKSIYALKHLESRQCVAVGNITSNYPEYCRLGKNPVVDRAYRNYTKRMVELGLVKVEGFGRWKIYEIAS